MRDQSACPSRSRLAGKVRLARRLYRQHFRAVLRQREGQSAKARKQVRNAGAAVQPFARGADQRGFAVLRRHRWLIGIVIVVYKLQDEYVTHVANVDRTELIRGLFS